MVDKQIREGWYETKWGIALLSVIMVMALIGFIGFLASGGMLNPKQGYLQAMCWVMMMISGIGYLALWITFVIEAVIDHRRKRTDEVDDC